MGNLLYIIAVLLIIGWAIGFIGYNVGASFIFYSLLLSLLCCFGLLKAKIFFDTNAPHLI
jgi:hypothetical protein